MKKKEHTKCSIKYRFFFLHVASLGPSEAKMFVSYSLIVIVLCFIIFSCVTQSESWY